MIVDQLYRQTLSGRPYWEVPVGHACGLLFKSLGWLWSVLAAMQGATCLSGRKSGALTQRLRGIAVAGSSFQGRVSQ